MISFIFIFISEIIYIYFKNKLAISIFCNKFKSKFFYCYSFLPEKYRKNEKKKGENIVFIFFY